jgi:hypothetical protein
LGASTAAVDALPTLAFSVPDLFIAPGGTVDFHNAGGLRNVGEVESDTSIARG